MIRMGSVMYSGRKLPPIRGLVKQAKGGVARKSSSCSLGRVNEGNVRKRYCREVRKGKKNRPPCSVAKAPTKDGREDTRFSCVLCIFVRYGSGLPRNLLFWRVELYEDVNVIAEVRADFHGHITVGQCRSIASGRIICPIRINDHVGTISCC